MKMKNLFIVIAAAVISFSFISCEEDFSPKADFKQKYVLWCVVNSDYKYDAAMQYAVLSKLYDVDGYDPEVNEEDPVLTGADVRLYVDDFEYEFTQDTTRRRDTTRYNTPFIYYRSDPVKLRYASILKITARLPSGEVLSSQTRLPLNEGLEFSKSFEGGFTTIKREGEIENEWTVLWVTDGNHLFFPRLKIRYTKTVGDTTLTGIQYAPLQYVNNEPLYPDYLVEQKVSFSYNAIDSAMAMISAGDSVKKNYHIVNFVFDFLEYDSPLSHYYSSINGYLDNYSVRLDETVYSNINGGIGIFGSTYFITRTFPVSPAYARKFGYD
jgi:hypothetical protein